MEVHLKIIGCLFVILALLHGGFPTYFAWEKELAPLSLINRQMMKVHTFFIALVIFLMGLLCLTSSGEIIETDFGKRISLGLGVFWVTRLAVQFFGYSKTLWKGKRFETAMHILFSLLWLYLSVIFFVVYFQ